MHDTDKIEQLTIGELLLKKGEKFVNPFQPSMYFLCCHIYIIYASNNFHFFRLNINI